ncbi:carbohydrate kinase [Thermoflavimicrobium dichotomicum]|uniref:Pseudouridine kinase n=1 Tax=Thermoflavimicrobium dichotomicum TaxID=46223 RepID=A0A1I3NX60_9BACL|nr:carbohydrate kinase [Thermoflavimicrobium dichotomicum]SFJ13801.1 pseudouridine kinase [Thermoflavimicrobium dichotomicum]
MDKEKRILEYIRMNPFISQQELANKIGISRSAVAGYIANLMKRGEIVGRAYVLRESSLITCIGGANLDRKARSKQKVVFHSSNPVTMTESCGGVARNVAENLGRLRCNVSLISCVGDDKEGHWVLQETKKHGVDVSQVWTFPSERTGTYTALLDLDGEMVISLADMEIYEQITPERLQDKWSYIATSQAVFLDTNIPEESIHYLVEHCRESEIPLYVDPVSSAKACKLPENLMGVEAILPNLEEAQWLAQMEVRELKDCRELCKRIRDRGVKNIVITLGEKGVFYASENEMGHLPPLKKMEVVDVTGSGDAFAAGFIYGMTNDEGIERACQLGLAAAALTLQTEKSVSPLLQPDRIYAMLEEESR